MGFLNLLNLEFFMNIRSSGISPEVIAQAKKNGYNAIKVTTTLYDAVQEFLSDKTSNI